MRRLSFPTALALLMLACSGVLVPTLAQGEPNAPVPVPALATVVPVANPVPLESPSSIAAPPLDAGPPGPTVADATVPTVRWLELVGHGYGHGRGLGQWGALGYATDLGWSYDRILAHFYGGTGPGRVSPKSALGVRLTGLDDRVLTVFHPAGRLWTASNGQSDLAPPPSLVQSVVPQVTEAGAAPQAPVAIAPVPVAAAASISGAAAASTTSTTGVALPAAEVVAGGPAALRIQLVGPGRR